MKWTECKKERKYIYIISNRIPFHNCLPFPKKLHLSIGVPGKQRHYISNRIPFHIRLPFPKKLHLSIGVPGKQRHCISNRIPFHIRLPFPKKITLLNWCPWQATAFLWLRSEIKHNRTEAHKWSAVCWLQLRSECHHMLLCHVKGRKSTSGTN